MEAVQLGEVVRFAEFAWRLYELGWSEDLQADEQYRQFGRDVRLLAESLKRLEGVIDQARQQFSEHRQDPPDTVRWDRRSLIEIIGDYSSTLDDCELLLQENRSYNATAGPGRNICWSLFVQPRVQKLRQRVLFHVSKIEHFLLPFQIDLTLWIHHDLVRRMEGLHRRLDQRIQGVHADVRLISQNLRVLMHVIDPSLSSELPAQNDSEVHEVPIPDDIHLGLEELYSRHPSHTDGGSLNPPLRDIADAFIRFFELSTKIFDADEINREAPEDQYLNLLASQFLMTKMVNSGEYLNRPEFSHWPSYVQSLRKKLSDECLRFAQTMATPQIWAGTTLPHIWPEEDAPSYFDTAELSRPMELLLLNMELATETNRTWRKITLYRYGESQDREFRLVMTAGHVGQPASQTSLSVNIDLAIASLVPQYATPDATQPLVLILNDGQHHAHRLVFREVGDLYLFQRALTGYEVLDNYMRYQLQVIFVVEGNRKAMERASLQLWRPRRLEGDHVISANSSDSGSTRRASNSTGSSGGRMNGNPGLERAGSMITPDLERRVRRVSSLNSTPINHMMSGARNSNSGTMHPGVSAGSPTSPIPSAPGPSQTNGFEYLNNQTDQPPATASNTSQGRGTLYQTNARPNGQRGQTPAADIGDSRDTNTSTSVPMSSTTSPQIGQPLGSHTLRRRQSTVGVIGGTSRPRGGGTDAMSSQMAQPSAPGLSSPRRTSLGQRGQHPALNTMHRARPPFASAGSVPGNSPPLDALSSQYGEIPAPNPAPNRMLPRTTPSSSSLLDRHSTQAGPSQSSFRQSPAIPVRTSSQSSRTPSGSTSGVYRSPTTTNPRHDSQTSPISPRTTLPPLHENSITTATTPTTTSPTSTLTSPFSFAPGPSPSPSTPVSRHLSVSTRTTRTTAATTTTAASSILSTASNTSQRTVSIASRANTAPTGTLHTKPTPPLLVLFTESLPPSNPPNPPSPPNLLSVLNPQLGLNNTNRPIMSTITITLDSPIQANHTVCNCAAAPHQCPITSLSHNTSGKTLSIRGLPKLDLFPFVSSTTSPSQPPFQNGVIRVSICFPSPPNNNNNDNTYGIIIPPHPTMSPPSLEPEPGWSPAALLRKQFSGTPCRCPRRTEGELMRCLSLGHGGKLGLVKELHRRAEMQWQRMRFENLRDVVGIGE